MLQSLLIMKLGEPVGRINPRENAVALIGELIPKNSEGVGFEYAVADIARAVLSRKPADKISVRGAHTGNLELLGPGITDPDSAKEVVRSISDSLRRDPVAVVAWNASTAEFVGEAIVVKDESTARMTPWQKRLLLSEAMRDGIEKNKEIVRAQGGKLTRLTGREVRKTREKEIVYNKPDNRDFELSPGMQTLLAEQEFSRARFEADKQKALLKLLWEESSPPQAPAK